MKHSRLTLIRAGLLAVVLTAGGALVAYATLPSASDGGQAHAAARGANGQQDSHPQSNGDVPTSVSDQLSANQDRLLSHLQDVVDQLSNGNASQHAVDALNKVIDRLTNEDIGLNRAMDATSGNTGKPATLPPVVSNHPRQS
jgi:hypothetical protein